MRVSRAASFTGVGLLHRLRAFLGGSKLHGHLPSSQALGLFQNAIASQAFAFFTGSGPFPKRIIFTRIRLLHRLWAFFKKDNLHRHSPSSQALGLFRDRTSGGVGCSMRSGPAPPPESPSARSQA